MILSIFDHLWQSTLFALVVGLLVLTMRTNSANARFGVWLAASLKFLIPFSVFVAVGKKLEWTGVSASAQWTLVISDIARPSSLFPVSSANTSHSYGLYVVMAVWALGFVAVVARWAVQWKRVMTAVRTATPVNLGVPIDTRFSPTVLEPGVVGIKNPVLLLPTDIESHLTLAQLQGVLAHELCHVRRRDNLTSALHMVVEALFWFYPLVWWLGARLIEERERACDEAVVRGGNDPAIYAEGILRVCKTYVGSRLVCTSGVSGGDLTKRIESIMRNRMVANLSLAKRVLLGFACSAALLGPIVVGLLDARPAGAQSGAATNQLLSRVKFDDSVIRISADYTEKSGDVIRFTGNVLLESIGSDREPIRISANKASSLGADTVAEGSLKIDGARKSMLMEGLRIEVDGYTLTSERAIMSAANSTSRTSFSMDAVEVVPTPIWKSLHATVPGN